MTGENEQTGKQQVVVHLTLKEYKVWQINIKQKNLKQKIIVAFKQAHMEKDGPGRGLEAEGGGHP